MRRYQLRVMRLFFPLLQVSSVAFSLSAQSPCQSRTMCSTAEVLLAEENHHKVREKRSRRGVPLRPQSMAAHAAPAWCKHTRTCSGRTRSSRFFWGRFGGKPSRDSLHTSQGGRSAQRSKQCSNFKLQRLEEYQEGHGFKLWRV